MDGQTPNRDTNEKRGKPWEQHEVQALCSFVKTNASTLFGTGGRGSMGVERQKIEAWNQCRLAIVSAGGRTDRSLEKIRKKWQDLASKAKKYNVQRKKQVHGTGGGVFVQPNETYELVLQALPNEIRDGITPIGNSETIPSIAQLPPVDATGKTSLPSSSSVFVDTEKAISTVHQSRRESASRSTVSSLFVEGPKRSAPRTESETEDSQETRQAIKKRKKGKKLKKDSDEVDLLSLNKTLVSTEDRKVVALEGILSTLKGIHGLLERISSTFNQSESEQ